MVGVVVVECYCDVVGGVEMIVGVEFVGVVGE